MGHRGIDKAQSLHHYWAGNGQIPGFLAQRQCIVVIALSLQHLDLPCRRPITLFCEAPRMHTNCYTQGIIVMYMYLFALTYLRDALI